MIPYDSKGINKDIIIKENVWIASYAFILPGVVINEGAVIAAGSVVTKDVPKCAVVGGNPGRIIKYRDEEEYNRLKENKEYYLKKKYLK